MLKEAIYKVVTRQDLTEAEMVRAMEIIMEGSPTEAPPEKKRRQIGFKQKQEQEVD